MFRLILLVFGVMMLAATPAVAPLCQEPGGIVPEKKLARALEKLADTCYQCGEKAKEIGLYTNARSFFDHALRYDGDHKKTRKVMGYRKRGGKWVLEEDMVPLSDKIVESRRPELELKLYQRTAEIREKAAESVFAFAADDKLELDQRLLALSHTLRLHPTHASALAMLRTTMDQRFGPAHELDRSYWHGSESRLALVSAGATFEEQTEYEKKMEKSYKKLRSSNFIFHWNLGETGDLWMPDASRWCEAGLALDSELLGVELKEPGEDDARRLYFSVVSTREEFGKFVEKCSNIPDGSKRSEIGKAGFGTQVREPLGGVWLYSLTTKNDGLRDQLTHQVGTQVISSQIGWRLYWMVRGFGYQASSRISATITSRFFAVKSTSVIDTGGKESLPGLGGTPAAWRIQTLIGLQEGSLSLDDLTAGQGARFSDTDAAFSFCLMDYLLIEKQEQLKAFLKDAAKVRFERYNDKQQPESAAELQERLMRHLETDATGFMAAFKEWAFKSYIDFGKDEPETK